MRLILFTGFLGSGKTTALLSLAGYLSRNLPPRSIAIIENEIGAANVDGQLLARSAYEVRDLTQGCICCTLTGQLLLALEEIRRDLKPRYLLVEATGVAHQTIADVIASAQPGLVPFSIAVVDAARWPELMESLPLLIGGQLARADLILINKAETVAEGDLRRLEEDMEEFNADSPRRRISAENDDLDAFWRKVVAHGGELPEARLSLAV
jgi:G3E family GTPase